MCPNCVTPWKCNGPHIPEELPDRGAGELADLMHQHRLSVNLNYVCLCGWDDPNANDAIAFQDAHRAHVAAVLIAAGWTKH